MNIENDDGFATSPEEGDGLCRRSSHHMLCYEITFKGHLDDHWLAWFHGCSLTREVDGTTVMVAPVVDQAELFGLLNKVRDLSLSLISVNKVDPRDDSTNI